ncbi:MAG: glycosyl hydrolase family 28-related protein [Stellaceae bacterium]
MELGRRGLFGAGAALGIAAAARPAQAAPPRRVLNAADFGAVGDGRADDTAALQKALDRTFAAGGTVLMVPPGTYRLTRTLRIEFGHGTSGNLGRQSGVVGHGARLDSEIADGGNVLEILCRATARFVLVEGLDILGRGREGHGIYVECDGGGVYFYNFCLRDVNVQGCGGDGCRLVGNVFEGQILNAYFRSNKGNGATFAHGSHGGILSALHVFGSVFGQNGEHGAGMIRNCYDVAFHGCYFLLNGKFGLLAGNGCTLLSNCGFENNHTAAKDFAGGDCGIHLNNFGTLVGCTAYSVFHQTGLLRAFVAGRLNMMGCTGSGGGSAAGAGLARLGGTRAGNATLIGCAGAVRYDNGFEALEIGGPDGGVRFGAHWQSRNLPQLGDYRLWIDRNGRLRIKRGAPADDDDGTPVGA